MASIEARIVAMGLALRVDDPRLDNAREGPVRH
jgi:hypothetical protein